MSDLLEQITTVLNDGRVCTDLDRREKFCYQEDEEIKKYALMNEDVSVKMTWNEIAQLIHEKTGMPLKTGPQVSERWRRVLYQRFFKEVSNRCVSPAREEHSVSRGRRDQAKGNNSVDILRREFKLK